MRFRTAQRLTLLAFLGLVAAFLGGLQPQRPVHAQRDVVQQELLDALQQDSQVLAIISLAGPSAASAAGMDVNALAQDNASIQDAVLAGLGPADFTLVRRYSVVPGLLGYVSASGVGKLANDPNVVSLSIDMQVPADLAESVPLIGANVVQDQGLDGSGVNIAVLDSGIDPGHPDLADSLIGEACFIYWHTLTNTLCPNDATYGYEPNVENPPPGFPDPNHPAKDDLGHGTHVSGIITSNGTVAPRGVAPGANVFAFRVMYPWGSGSLVDIGGAIDVFDCMVTSVCLASLGLPSDFKFDFANMSWGTSGVFNEACDGSSPEELPALRFAIELARSQGVLTFAASGNAGSTTGIAVPTCYSSVVSVGATYDADVGPFPAPPAPNCRSRPADSTTYADKVTCFSNVGDDLTMFAPGAVITSTAASYLPSGHCVSSSGSGSANCSGTSMASPMALAAAALVKQALPNGTPDEIVDILKRTGVSVTDSRDAGHIYTKPRVDARAAVEALTGYSLLLTFPGSPGLYENYLADIQQQETYPTAKTLCYFDSPGVTVNPQAANCAVKPGPTCSNGGVNSCPPASPKYCGDGQAGAPPPGCALGSSCVPSAPNCSSLPCDVSQYQFADVDASHTQLSGFLDLSSHNMNLSGCFQDFDGVGQWGNVFVQMQINFATGTGSASVYKFQSFANCTAGTPSGTAVAATVNAKRLPMDSDSDGDGCPDKRELADTPGGTGTGGGLRDPSNRWDYFNPEKVNTPHQQTVADILYVVGKYGKNQGNAAYTVDTDRTALIGGNVWNLGPPDGQQTVADILAAVKQYNQNC
jgi:subtilisin family serine protease